MSKQIENNVVQMTFDNRDFERNISTSTKSIERLNEELKFKDANKGFQDLEKYANSVNFDGLNKAIENINSVFTVTGNLCKKVVDDIAGYFESKIVSAVSFVKNKTIGVMDFSGANEKYKQYTTGMNTLVANMTAADKARYEQDRSLGLIADELEYIDAYAEKLMTFADETSYSFSDMFETLAKYSSNNVDMKNALSAIMGLANAAAVAGQSAKTATMSFQQISQAFGRGYVMYQDWAQAFSSKHIDTATFKKNLVETAHKMGVLKDEVIESAKKENPSNWVDIFFQSDTLNQGWMKIDVLNTALEEYSKATNYLLNNIDSLYHGEEMTFSNMLGILDDFKAAKEEAEKLGREFTTIDFVNDLASKNKDWQIDIYKMRDALDELAKEEYDLSVEALKAAQQATNFEEAMDSLKDAFATRFMKIMKYFIGDLYQARELWTSFCDSLYEVFVGPLNNALDGFEAWNKGILETEEGTKELEYTYEVFWGSLGRIFTAIGSFFDGFLDRIRIALGAFEEDKDGTITALSIIETYTLSFLTKITEGVEYLAGIVEDFLDSEFYRDLLSIFTNILHSFLTIKSIMFRFLGTILMKLLRNLKQPLKIVSELLVKLTEKLSNFLDKIANSERLERFLTAIGKITEKLMELITKVLSKLFGQGSKLGSGLSKILTKLVDILIPALDWLLDAIDDYLLPAMDELIEGPYSIGAGLDWLGEKFEDACRWVKNFATNVLGISFEDAKTKIKDFAGFVKEKLTGSDGGVFDILFGFIGETFSSDTPGTFGDLINQIAEANSIAEGAAATLNWTGDALMRPIKLILDLAGEIIGVDLTGLTNAISNFVHGFTDAVAEITPDVLDAIEKVGGLIVKILGFVASVVASIFQYLLGSKESTGFDLLDKIIDSIKTLIVAVVNMVGFIIQKVAKIATLISPALMQVIDWMGVVIENVANMIVDMVKQFATIKSTDELLEHLWKMVKFFLGFILIMQLLTVITGITNIVKKISSATNTLSDAVDTLTGGLNKAINGLFGNNFGGMMRTFAVLLFAFGYALSQVVKAGSALADPKTKEGMMTAITAMMAIILIFTWGAVRLLKLQTSAYDRLHKALAEKEKAQKRWDKYTSGNLKGPFKKARSWLYFRFNGEGDEEAMNKDTESMKKEAESVKDSLANAAGLIVALAGGLLLISKALSILANAANKTSAADLRVAAGAVVIIIAALGVFLHYTKVMQKYSDQMNKTGSSTKSKSGWFKNRVSMSDSIEDMTKSSSFEGESYVGIASAIVGLSVGLYIIARAMAILTKAVSGNKVNMTVVWGFMMGLIVALGTIIVLTAKFGNGENVSGVEALGKTIGSIGKTVIAIVISVVAIAWALKKLKLSDKDLELVKLVYKGILFIVGILGAVAVLISIFSKKKEIEQTASNNTLIKNLNIKFMGIFFSLGSFFLMFGAGVWLLVNAINSSKELNNGRTPQTFWVAMLVIIGIIGVLFIFIKEINKLSSGSNAKEIAANFAGITATIWSISAMVTTIVAAIVGMAALIALVRKLAGSYDSLIWAVSIMGGMLLAIAGLMFVLSKIAKSMGGTGDNAGKPLISMAVAVIAMAAALVLLGFGIAGLAKVLKKVGWTELLKAAAVMATGIVLILLLSKVATVLKVALDGLIATGIALLILIAGGLAVIGLCMLVGDEVLEWMANNEDKIRKFFKAISSAFVDAIIGLIQGLAEKAPELIASLGDLIIAVLVGLTKFVKTVKFQTTLGEFIGTFIASLIGALIIAIDTLWNTILEWFDCGSPSKKTQTFGEWLMEGLLNGLKMFWDAILDFFRFLGEEIENIWNNIVDSVTEQIERLVDTSNRSLAEIDHQRAIEREKDTFEFTKKEKLKGYAQYVEEYMAAYKKVGLGYYREGTAEYEQAKKELEEIQNRSGNQYQYSIEGFLNKSEEERKMIRDYAYQMGYDTTAGFLQGLMGNQDPEKIGDRYMRGVIDGGKKAADIKSPSGVFEYIGTMLNAGLENAFNADSGCDAGTAYGDALINGVRDATGVHSKSSVMEYIGEMLNAGAESSFNEESGAKLGDQFASGVTGAVTDKLSGVTTALNTVQDIFKAKSSGGSVLGILSNSLLGTNIGGSTGGLVLDMSDSNVSFDANNMNSVLGDNSYQDMLNVSDLSDMSGYNQIADINDLGNLNYGSNWNVLDSPSNMTSNLAYDTASTFDSYNSEVVSKLDELNNNLIAWREASSKTAIYMNNDVLVGEIVEPMDKALGNRAQLKANRGV